MSTKAAAQFIAVLYESDVLSNPFPLQPFPLLSPSPSTSLFLVPPFPSFSFPSYLSLKIEIIFLDVFGNSK